MSDSVLEKELKRLLSNCQAKKEALMEISNVNSAKRKSYAICSGILSISSAVLLTAVIGELVPGKLVQFLSVLLAATGGVVALLSTFLYSESEVSNLHLGSSKFQAIREKANFVLLHDYLDEDESFNKHSELVSEYLSASEIYDKYVSNADSLKLSFVSKYKSEPTSITSDDKES